MNIFEAEEERQIGIKTAEADITKWIENFGIPKTVDICDEKIVQLFDSLLITEVDDVKVPPYVQGLSKIYEGFIDRHAPRSEKKK